MELQKAKLLKVLIILGIIFLSVMIILCSGGIITSIFQCGKELGQAIRSVTIK